MTPPDYENPEKDPISTRDKMWWKVQQNLSNIKNQYQQKLIVSNLGSFLYPPFPVPKYFLSNNTETILNLFVGYGLVRSPCPFWNKIKNQEQTLMKTVVVKVSLVEIVKSVIFIQNFNTRIAFLLEFVVFCFFLERYSVVLILLKHFQS